MFDGQFTAQIDTQVMLYAQQFSGMQERVGGDPYNAGLNALQRSQYERAVELFDRVVSDPDLQLEGVRLLVSRRDAQTTDAVLRGIYDSSTEAPVRRLIIDAYRRRSTGPRRGPSPQAAAQLAALYDRETDLDLRRQIASALVSLGAADRVITVIRTERDPQVRQRLVRTLGRALCGR